jgi:hypothetical protein
MHFWFLYIPEKYGQYRSLKYNAQKEHPHVPLWHGHSCTQRRTTAEGFAINYVCGFKFFRPNFGLKIAAICTLHAL